jgi:hypothetical protein
MEHAKINGIELAHEVVGSGEAMLLIHGSHIADLRSRRRRGCRARLPGTRG